MARLAPCYSTTTARVSASQLQAVEHTLNARHTTNQVIRHKQISCSNFLVQAPKVYTNFFLTISCTRLIELTAHFTAPQNMTLPTNLTTENRAHQAGDEEEFIGQCRLRHAELLNGDVKIHYVECGNSDGDLVLLLHGFPNFWYVWKNQFQALAEAGFHVIAPDLRGYNTSSKPLGVTSYARQPVLSDIVCIIDHFGAGKRAIVVGHDWGGAITWALAEDYPSKLRKIVVVNSPHFSVLDQAFRTNLRQLCRSWYIFFFQLSWLPELFMSHTRYRSLRRLLEFGPCRPLPAIDVARHVIAFSETGAVHSSINYYRAAYQGLWAAKSGSKPVGIQLPVGIIWGEDDHYLGKELAEPPKSLASNVSITFLPGCSHWPMWDEPDHFNQVLLSHLARESVGLVPSITADHKMFANHPRL